MHSEQGIALESLGKRDDHHFLPATPSAFVKWRTRVGQAHNFDQPLDHADNGATPLGILRMNTRDSAWSLHPTLEADCHRLLSDEFGEVLMQRNASLHWLLLVPKTKQIDLIDLPPDDLAVLVQRARAVGQMLKTDYGYPRVNVGALGLLVPQLHLHVIGRSPEDPCWPNPVWGQLPDGPEYTRSAINEIRQRLGVVLDDITGG